MSLCKNVGCDVMNFVFSVVGRVLVLSGSLLVWGYGRFVKVSKLEAGRCVGLVSVIFMLFCMFLYLW